MTNIFRWAGTTNQAWIINQLPGAKRTPGRAKALKLRAAGGRSEGPGLGFTNFFEVFYIKEKGGGFPLPWK